MLETLDKQLAAIDREVDDHIDRHFKDQRTLLDSVKGVGPTLIWNDGGGGGDGQADNHEGALGEDDP